MKKLYTLLLVALMAIGASAQPCDAVVQVSPAHDTICDGDMTLIKLSGPAIPIDTLRFRYTVESPPGITITSGPQIGLPLGYEIADQIVNTTDAAQLVLFIITPYLINPDESVNCAGTPDTAFVWVEPTTRVIITPINDTVSDGDNLSITLTSASIPTREVRLRYTTEVPSGVTVTPGSGTNIPPNFTIIDQIENTTDAAKLVLFIVSPYSRNTGDDGERCTGVNDTAFIWVKPNPEYLTVTVDNVIEDPCEGGNKGAIEITVTGGTPPYTFNWDGPYGMQRFEEDIYNLPGGTWDLAIQDTLGNTINQSIFVPIASGMLTATVESEYGSLEYKYNISEFGKSDGWIQVEYVLNGNGNPEDYQFTYDHNGWKYSTGYQDTISGLEAGDYILVVTDTLGCTDTIHTSLSEPDPETVIDTVEVIKFTEVADEATLINPITQATIWVKNYGDYIRTSETFSECYVYDITGSVKGIYSNEIEIPVDHLETGIYIFAFKFGSTKIVQRFYIE